MLCNSKQSTATDRNFFYRLINRFLGVFFRYLYHEMAWSYDWVAAIVSLGRWKSWVGISLDDIVGHKVLELGHGPGHLMAKMLHAGKQAYGIDLSPQMSKIASARLKRYPFPINLSIARAQSLPFRDEVFDHVVATFPTEYILQENTLFEIKRVLKHGGSAVIVPVAYITGKSLFDKAAALLFRITGQSPIFEPRALEPAVRTGFMLNTRRISLQNSDVIVIIASKP